MYFLFCVPFSRQKVRCTWQTSKFHSENSISISQNEIKHVMHGNTSITNGLLTRYSSVVQNFNWRPTDAYWDTYREHSWALSLIRSLWKMPHPELVAVRWGWVRPCRTFLMRTAVRRWPSWGESSWRLNLNWIVRMLNTGEACFWWGYVKAMRSVPREVKMSETAEKCPPRAEREEIGCIHLMVTLIHRGIYVSCI